MAKLEAKVTCYKISQCGYYDKKGDLLFGSPVTMLNDLLKWVGIKTFEDTNILDINNNDELPCYLYDISKKNDCYLITLWHETVSKNNTVASVPKKSKVGAAIAKVNKIAKDTIPGYPTYFFFVPKENIIATVQFPDPIRKIPTNHKIMQNYMNTFLTCHSSNVILKQLDKKIPDLTITGYENKSIQYKVKDVKVSYESSMIRKPTDTQYLLDNASLITKLVHRIELSPSNAINLDMWQKALIWAKISPQPLTKADRVNFSYEVSVDMTENDIQSIIDNDGVFNSYGIKFRGDSKTYWIKGNVIREEFTVDVKYDIPNVVNNKSLLNSLYTNKDKILNLIK